MLNKRRLHHVLVILRQVRLWHLLLALVIVCALSALLLRQNNLNMIELRNLVIRADEQNKDIPSALANLHNYIAAHMNTGMGDQGVYLEHSYQRAYETALAHAKNGSGGGYYRQAEEQCQKVHSKTTDFQAFTQCLVDKVAESGITADPVGAMQAPSAELFRYNFISPAWSSDLAGYSLLVSLLLLVLIFTQIALVIVFKILLSRHRQLS